MVIEVLLINIDYIKIASELNIYYITSEYLYRLEKYILLNSKPTIIVTKY